MPAAAGQGDRAPPPLPSIPTQEELEPAAALSILLLLWRYASRSGPPRPLPHAHRGVPRCTIWLSLWCARSASRGGLVGCAGCSSCCATR